MVWTEISTTTTDVRAVVDRFNHALNHRDLRTIGELLTEDTVCEDTAPAPDGARYVGKAAVLAFWEAWLAANGGARFETEEVIVAGNRCVVRWTCRRAPDGRPWHRRGVDVFTIRANRIAAKLSYVKA